MWHVGQLVKLEAGPSRLSRMVRVRLLPRRSYCLVTGIKEWWKRFDGIRRASLFGLLN